MVARKAKDDASTQDVEVRADAVEEVVAPAESYTDADYRSITNFTDALQAAQAVTGIINASDEIGDGFHLVKGDDEKRNLIGVPMIVMEWAFTPGDYGDKEFVTMRIVVPIDPQDSSKGVRKLIVNDGSTGLCRTLRDITDSLGKSGGLVVKHGFRESVYDYCQDCNKPVRARLHDREHNVGPASTFYFDTSD